MHIEHGSNKAPLEELGHLLGSVARRLLDKVRRPVPPIQSVPMREEARKLPADEIQITSAGMMTRLEEVVMANPGFVYSAAISFVATGTEWREGYGNHNIDFTTGDLEWRAGNGVDDHYATLSVHGPDRSESISLITAYPLARSSSFRTAKIHYQHTVKTNETSWGSEQLDELDTREAVEGGCMMIEGLAKENVTLSLKREGDLSEVDAVSFLESQGTSLKIATLPRDDSEKLLNIPAFRLAAAKAQWRQQRIAVFVLGEKEFSVTAKWWPPRDPIQGYAPQD